MAANNNKPMLCNVVSLLFYFYRTLIYSVFCFPYHILYYPFHPCKMYHCSTKPKIYQILLTPYSLCQTPTKSFSSLNMNFPPLKKSNHPPLPHSPPRLFHLSTASLTSLSPLLSSTSGQLPLLQYIPFLLFPTCLPFISPCPHLPTVPTLIHPALIHPTSHQPSSMVPLAA